MNAGRIIDEKGAEVFGVDPASTLAEAARELDRRRVGAVVALNGAMPVGVFSERDLARRVAERGAAALEETVESAMTRALVTAGPEADLDQLMRLMTDRRVRHVIIVEGERMIGLVSIGDVVKRKIAEAEAEAAALKDYIAHG